MWSQSHNVGDAPDQFSVMGWPVGTYVARSEEHSTAAPLTTYCSANSYHNPKQPEKRAIGPMKPVGTHFPDDCGEWVVFMKVSLHTGTSILQPRQC